METTGELIHVTRTGATLQTGERAGSSLRVNEKEAVNGLLILIKKHPKSVEIFGFDPENPSVCLWGEQEITPGVYLPTTEGLEAASVARQVYGLLIAHDVDERAAESHAWKFDGLEKQLPQFRVICNGVCKMAENGDLALVLINLASCISIEGVCNVLHISPESLGPRNGRDGELVGAAESLAETLFELIA